MSGELLYDPKKVWDRIVERENEAQALSTRAQELEDQARQTWRDSHDKAHEAWRLRTLLEADGQPVPPNTPVAV